MTHLIRRRLPPLAALSLLTLPLPAQRVVANPCHANFNYPLSEFGRSVAMAGDTDGDGTEDWVVGAPGTNTSSCGCVSGAIFLQNSYTPVYGDDGGDRMGTSVAGGLNLDGDGLADVIAGAPGDDDGGAEAGSVRAFSGGRTVLYTVHGTAAGDELGASVAALEDLDGDGFDELLLGAPQRVGGGAGYARVVSGATGATLRRHAGTAPGDRFGLGLTALADLDGDGLGEYAVGAPGEGGTGRVWIFSGKDGSLVRTHDGKSPGEEFGYALGSGTDVDRDGIAELLVGAPRSGLAVGDAWAFSGRTGTALLSLAGSSPQGWFGAAIAGAGDFDGDGHGDVVVGEPAADPTTPVGFAFGNGWGTVFSGADGSVLARMGGGSSTARMGVSVAGGGDLDGDGLADVLIGGLLNNDGYGETACVTGLGRGRSQRIDGGPATFSAYGQALAGVGDLDADETPDLLIGASMAVDPAGRRTGMARLVSGRTGAVLRELWGVADGDRFGQCVANAGDVDGDGLDDLLVGSSDDDPFASTTGYARVFSGATGALVHHFDGPGTASFGGALAGQGDVDADGFADLIVGSEVGTHGSVRVYSGRTGAELLAFDDPPGAREGLGASVTFLDDLDGDGHDDLAFGIPDRFVEEPFYTLGEVEVRSGADGSLLAAVSTFYFRVGTALTRLGDVNGDGFEDFAFSTWDDQFLWSYGSVHAISGRDFSELWMVEGQVPYQGFTFGYALAAAGDHDGDGASEIAIGEPGTIDWHARSIGRALVLSGADGSFLSSFEGYAGWDYFGYSVAGIGDVNGDGEPDLAVGAPTEPDNNEGGEAGWNRVHVVLSNDLERCNHCRLSVNSTGQPARISARGLGSLALGDVTLEVTGVPALTRGLFLMGARPTVARLSDGYRCVAGNVSLVKPVVTGADGRASTRLDFARAPANTILAGESWSFQFLFVDGGGFNTSDAVRLSFLP